MMIHVQTVQNSGMNVLHTGRSLSLAVKVASDQTAERNTIAQVSMHTMRDSG